MESILTHFLLFYLGQFGFLSYEVDEGKKLFFHTSEVEGGEILQQGDEVEFVVVTNKRTGKHSACCVRKLRYNLFKEGFISIWIPNVL